MKYPNLELLEYMAREYLELLNYGNRSSFKFIATTFPQEWGSTALGFDTSGDGFPMWGGQAMTIVYTTVLYEMRTKVYVVFFDSKPCYLVSDANDLFLSDLQNQNLVSISEAKRRY